MPSIADTWCSTAFAEMYSAAASHLLDPQRQPIAIPDRSTGVIAEPPVDAVAWFDEGEVGWSGVHHAVEVGRERGVFRFSGLQDRATATDMARPAARAAYGRLRSRTGLKGWHQRADQPFFVANGRDVHNDHRRCASPYLTAGVV